MQSESGSPSAEEVLARLDRVIASSAFRGAAVEKRLLRFLVERALENDRSALEETAIATAVFGRGDAADPRLESVVPATADRVRQKLKRYYAAARRVTVVIELPKDTYLPLFTTRAPVKPLRQRPVFWSVVAVALALIAVVSYRLVKRPPPRYYQSIAVLPFRNFVAHQDAAKLASVLPGDLSARLVKLRKIRVAPADSGSAITKQSELAGVANRLSVDTMLTGSVIFKDSRVGIVVELFDKTGRSVWGDIYQPTPFFVPTVEKDIVYAVSRVLAAPIRQ